MKARRRLVQLGIGLAALAVLLAGLLLAAGATETGARLVWQLALRALPEHLAGEFAGGTLARGIRLRALRYQQAGMVFSVDRASAEWRLGRDPLTLILPTLHLGQADLTLPPGQSGQPPSLPQRLELPLALELQDVRIDRLLLRRPGQEQPLQLDGIRLQGNSDGLQHHLRLQLAGSPAGRLEAELALGGAHPFPLHGSASLEGRWEQESYRLQARAEGTLESFALQLEASGDRLGGNARIQATPFAALPFGRATIDLRHLNPRLFHPAAPQADLELHADLSPSLDPARPELSALRLAGPISLANARPGGLDQELLPLAHASASAVLEAEQQEFSQLEILAPGGGRLSGSAHMQGPSHGRLQLQASGLDLRALHGALLPTRLRGPLEVELDGATQHLRLDWNDSAFAAQLEAELNPAHYLLSRAHLQSGPSQLHASGSMERGGYGEFTLQGRLESFDPARFLSALRLRQAAMPAALVNMEFDASGALRPRAGANLNFTIHDSRYAGLPMSGSGRLRLEQNRLADSDAELLVAGNQARLKGSFGAANDQLAFQIEAPALDRLGFGLAGRLQAEGKVGGTLQRPTLDARFQGERLVFGSWHATRLEGQGQASGLPDSSQDAPLALRIDAQGLRGPMLDIGRLHAGLDGSYGRHTLTLEANGKLRGQPLTLTASAEGSLTQQAQGPLWEGSLKSLENTSFPQLRLQAPAQLSIGAGRLGLEQVRLSLEQARLELQSLEFSQGSQLRSRGSLSGLNLDHVLRLARLFGGASIDPRTDLVLDGQWDLDLGQNPGGSFRFERRSGDIALPGALAQRSLGLDQTWLRGQVAGEQLQFEARIEAGRIGNAAGHGSIALQRRDGLLLPDPDSALSAQLKAELPRLQSLVALTGPGVALEGRAVFDLQAAGTLAQPRLSGRVDGEQLSLTLFEQGVRLRDGVAHLTLDDNVIELRQVEFHAGEGTLKASGRLPLAGNGADLSATVVAERLQLLADPSATLTLSGQAELFPRDGQLHANGKFTVDEALVSMPEQRAPSLGDDVVIIQPGKETAAPAAPSGLLPVANIEIDLGPRFRFRGAGANLRLAGSLNIRSAPGQAPQAYGTIRIASGDYEAFGTRLEVENGVLNFNGPFNNPNLNIRAMRRNQEVAAGVQITGTVRQPRVQLVSEPDLPEEEKLSWLVFGRGASTDTGGTQAAAKGAARSAALGLLNNLGGKRVARGLGLDDITFSTVQFGNTTQDVVTLGKNISDRLRIGYEQSLAGTGSVLKLTYELGRAWSITLRGGQVTGVDIMYNKRFDRIIRR